jgi:low affinity Fe/Cu permease
MSIVTLISLTVTFLQERRHTKGSDSDATVDEYIEWLRRNEHAEIVDAISTNTELLRSLQNLFQSNHDELSYKLDELNSAVTAITKHLTSWSDITNSLPHEFTLPDQALSILRWLNSRDSSGFILIKTRGGPDLVPLDGKGDRITIEDPRFLHDDLNTLCYYGLLTSEPISQSDTRYRITRNGAKVGT